MKLIEQMAEYQKLGTNLSVNGIDCKISGIYDNFVEILHSEVKEDKQKVKHVSQETILIPFDKIESVSEGLHEIEPE